MTVQERYRIAWSHGTAEVVAAAAMLTDVAFVMPNGAFRPFAVAPWSPDDPGLQTLPGHMRYLGAEFVCLPFGGGGTFTAAAPGWDEAVFGPQDNPFHGAPADLAWTLEQLAQQRISLTLDLPAPSPIRRLERVIAGIDGSPALDLQLTVHARKACRLPLGLHPILKLPDTPGDLLLEADFQRGITFPADGEGMGVTAPGVVFERLSAVPGREGPIDFSRLPLENKAESVVQLFGIRGPVTAVFQSEGCGLRISWPTDLLPSLQIWLSDRALTAAPWNGSYRGVGLEPLASVFDLGSAAAVGGHPAIPPGVATFVSFDPAAPMVVNYRLAAFQTSERR